MHQLVSHFDGKTTAEGIDITWQQGPIGGRLAGATVEGVIRAAIARLDEFQAGPRRCEENRRALAHLHGALAELDKRTADRYRRGVMGTERP